MDSTAYAAGDCGPDESETALKDFAKVCGKDPITKGPLAAGVSPHQCNTLFEAVAGSCTLSALQALDDATCTGTSTELATCTGTATTIAEVTASCTGTSTDVASAATCTTTDIAACAAVTLLDDATACEAAGACTYTAASGGNAATCTTTVVPACAAATSSEAACTCAGACTFTDATLKICDLDATTDSSADCPTGCTEVVEAAETTPTCELTDGVCPAGCDTTAKTCDLDASTDSSADCPAGCNGGLHTRPLMNWPNSNTAQGLSTAITLQNEQCAVPQMCAYANSAIVRDPDCFDMTSSSPIFTSICDPDKCLPQLHAFADCCSGTDAGSVAMRAAPTGALGGCSAGAMGPAGADLGGSYSLHTNAGTCATTEIPACAAVAELDDATACEAAGACTYAPANCVAGTPASCTTTPVAACAAVTALDTATACEAAGACTYTASSAPITCPSMDAYPNYNAPTEEDKTSHAVMTAATTAGLFASAAYLL